MFRVNIIHCDIEKSIIRINTKQLPFTRLASFNPAHSIVMYIKSFHKAMMNQR